ncbi:MFS transporter [Halostreptopolyspora alba]|uniref:MFS transporter n=1 Tax=Halostreptopolyspora alba TaxID=2487137 RepID=UPI003715D80B
MRPTTREGTGSTRVLLGVLVAAMLLMVIATDMVNLVLPLMGTEFGASEAQLAWVVTGFLLVFSIGIPFYGRIADRVRLRRLFSAALLVYAAGSLVCALAPTLLVVVVGRVVMGAGAGAIPVLSVVAVTRVLPPNKRGIGVGFISAAGGVGTAAGPAVGGGLGQLFGWPALFWLTLVCALVLVPMTMRVLPDDSPGTREPFDIVGGVLLGLSAGLLLFGITQQEVAGFGAPSAWGALVGAAVATLLFLLRIRGTAHPFVPPSLFANPVYVAAVVVIFLAMFTNLAALVFVPVLVVDVNGLSPGAGSLVMIPGGVALAVASPLAGRLSDRAGARLLTVSGLIVIGVSTFFLSSVGAGGPALPAAVGVLGLGVGVAFVLTTVTNAAAGALPVARIGVGLGTLQGAQFLGAGTGPALMGALLVARKDGAGESINPLHDQAASAFSDVFLVLTLLVVPALVAALRLRPSSPSQSGPDGSERTPQRAADA